MDCSYGLSLLSVMGIATCQSILFEGKSFLMSKYGIKGEIIISWILVIFIFIFLLFCSYIRAAWVNFKILQRKDVSDCKWFTRTYYIASGPWTTPSILSKKDKELSQEESLYNYYRDDLMGGLWLKTDNKQMDRILKELSVKDLNLDERIILKGYTDIDKIGKKSNFNIFSIFIPMIVAVFIGFGAAHLSESSSVEKNVAFYGAMGLVSVYIIVIAHLSRREAKTSIVRKSLDVYDEIIKNNDHVTPPLKQRRFIWK